MKKLLPAFMLAGGLLLLTACAGTVNESNTAPTAPPGDTVVVATPPPATQTNPSTAVVPDEQPPAESDTNFTAAMPEEDVVDMTGFIPMERGTWLWDLYPDAENIATCPVTFVVYVDGVVASYQVRDYAGSPVHNQPPQDEPIQEPTWTAPTGNFHASLMNVGVYPAEWAERHPVITPRSFQEAMMAHNSNMQLIGTLNDLDLVDFIAPPTTTPSRLLSMAWNNGVVTASLSWVQNPAPGIFAWMSLDVWFTDERDPQTGALSDSIIQVFHSYDMNAVWSLHAGGSEFGVEFARQLWDALALLDQADSYADIEAARRAFE